MTGQEAVLATDTGFWRITLGNIPLTTVQQQKCWRAIQGLLMGRANAIDVPLGVWTTAPWPLDDTGRRLPREIIPFDDGSLFCDGTGWAQNLITATMRAAALRATTVTIDLVQGADIEPGQVFGIGGTRAHLIKTVSQDGDAYTCTITPPLRAAVAADTEVDFDNPRVQCVLAEDNAMAAEFDLARFGAATLQFIERW
jgi:hypothetical protein